jgi:hypothetical protein
MKEGAPGKPIKYCVCHQLSYKGKAQSSVNNKIDSDDFPTCWGKAADATEIVCPLNYYSSYSMLVPLVPLSPSLTCIQLSCSSLPYLTPYTMCVSPILFSHAPSPSPWHGDHPATSFAPPNMNTILLLFSTLAKVIICDMQTHTCESFEGHFYWG